MRMMSEAWRALTTFVLDLLSQRELMLAHRGVQIVDVVAFSQHAP